MTEILREVVSRPNEFHLFLNSVRPGLARERTYDAFRTLSVPNTNMVGYVPAPINAETLNRITPKDRKIGSVSPSFFGNVRLVYAITKSHGGHHIIKAVLQNRESKHIVILTAHDYVSAESHVPAVATGWYVLNCDMIAPGGFWEAAKLSL